MMSGSMLWWLDRRSLIGFSGYLRCISVGGCRKLLIFMIRKINVREILCKK